MAELKIDVCPMCGYVVDLSSIERSKEAKMHGFCEMCQLKNSATDSRANAATSTGTIEYTLSPDGESLGHKMMFTLP